MEIVAFMVCKLYFNKAVRKSLIYISSVQLLSHVWLVATPWTAARQASLSITNSWSLLKLMFIESVMPSNRLILFHPLSSYLQAFPATGSFLMSQFFTSGGQSIGVSALASVPPMNIQDWLPLGLTGSPCSPRDFLSFQDFKSLLQHHSPKASILRHSVFFIYYPIKASWGQFHFFIFQTM